MTKSPSRTRKLKVFGTLLVRDRRYDHESLTEVQVRGIIATTTQKEAARLMNLPIGYFRDYAAETFNDLELETALASPGTLFTAKSMDPNPIFRPSYRPPYVVTKRRPLKNATFILPRKPEFTESELKAIADRFAFANDDTGQLVHQKAMKMLRGEKDGEVQKPDEQES